MTSLSDSAAIFSYHQEMIAMHGSESSYALGWKDSDSQQVRFKALIEMADLSGCSVLDAGCGYGDLFPYLSGIYNEIEYVGIEQIPALLNEASSRYGHLPGTRFISGNFITMPLPATGYIFASGSLNYRSADQNFIYKAISKLYAACRFGFAFNLLSQIIPNGLIVAYQPDEIIEYCSTLCSSIKLIQGYDADDFTIYMYKTE